LTPRRRSDATPEWQAKEEVAHVDDVTTDKELTARLGTGRGDPHHGRRAEERIKAKCDSIGDL
jgi:hypothetical protein